MADPEEARHLGRACRPGMLGLDFLTEVGDVANPVRLQEGEVKEHLAQSEAEGGEDDPGDGVVRERPPEAARQQHRGDGRQRLTQRDHVAEHRLALFPKPSVDGVAGPLRHEVPDDVACALTLDHQACLLLHAVVLVAVDGVHDQVQDDELEQPARPGHQEAHEGVVGEDVLGVGVGDEAKLLEAVAVPDHQGAVEVDGHPRTGLLAAGRRHKCAPRAQKDEAHGEEHLHHRKTQQGVHGGDDILAKWRRDAEHGGEREETKRQGNGDRHLCSPRLLTPERQASRLQAGVQGQNVEEQDCQAKVDEEACVEPEVQRAPK
mmetsp:Transcript_149641/g.461996  ORF Transcript_149641/g.461996 Transcript_149641/m.461996 type:complete len:319 (+) Transcript_149641:318-1274(+)